MIVDYGSVSGKESGRPGLGMLGVAVAVGNCVVSRTHLDLATEDNDLEARRFLSDVCDRISDHLVISRSSNQFDSAVMLFESPTHARVMLKWVERLAYFDRIKTCARLSYSLFRWDFV